MIKKTKVCDGCNKDKIIWKNDKGTRYCQSCWYSLNQGENKPKLNAQSVKRKKDNQEYLRLRKTYLEKHSLCHVRFKNCTHYSTEVHHKYNGPLRNTYLLVQSTWVATCTACHQEIHLFPEKARKLNLLK